MTVVSSSLAAISLLVCSGLQMRVAASAVRLPHKGARDSPPGELWGDLGERGPN